MAEDKVKKSRSGIISENNIRMSLVVPKKLKAELATIAGIENRSLNNLIVTVMQQYSEEYKKRQSKTD